MNSGSKKGRSQDRRKVAGGQSHEVRYEKEKMGVSGAEVKEAVKAKGNDRKKIEATIKKSGPVY